MSTSPPPPKTHQPPKPVSRRRTETRARLLTAAAEVFAERGFHGASVEDICERAGFTRGAFYSNFTSKDELVLELSARHTARVVARIHEAAARPAAEPDDVLREVIASLADDAPARDRWLQLTTELSLHALRDPEARIAWAEEQRRIRSALVDAVNEAVARRGAALALPTELFVRAAVALVGGAAAQRQLEPGSLAAGELESAVLTVLLRPAP